MKKFIIVFAFCFVLGTGVASAQTVEPTQIDLIKELIQLVSILNTTITGQLSAMDARITVLEQAKAVSYGTTGQTPVIVSNTPSQADLDAVALIRRDLPATVGDACGNKVGKDRRTWDRIFNLMCTQSGY